MKVQIVRTSPASNVSSVVRGLTFLGFDFVEVKDASSLKTNLPVIIPGVGTFSGAMEHLASSSIDFGIKNHGGHRAPIVGICLGMQIMTQWGTEGGTTQGLGLVSGRVIPITTSPDERPILNLGFKRVHSSNTESLLSGRFYFANSYIATDILSSDVAATSSHPRGSFPAAVVSGGIIGFQFHPELSGLTGMNLLKKYLTL